MAKLPLRFTPRFSNETLPFILRSSRQKSQNWLDRNREEYEALLLNPLKHLAFTLKTELAPQAPGYHFPLKGIGRLKRDKTWVTYSTSTPRKSRFETHPNLVFIMQPTDPDGDQVLVAGGLYMPSSQQLRAIRTAIAESPSFVSQLEDLFESKAFSKRFKGGFCRDKCSSRIPRGFDPHHPKIQWIQLQAFFVWRSYTLREFTSSGFADLVAQDWAQILRLNHLLEQAIQPRDSHTKSTQKPLIGEIQAPTRTMDF